MTGAPRLDPPPLGGRGEIAVEIVIASAAVGFGFALLPPSTAAFGAVLAVTAIVVAAVDRRLWLIPDTAVAVLAVVGVTAAWFAAGSDDRVDVVLDAATRAIAAGGSFWALRSAFRLWRGVEGLGLGDVKLAAAGAVWLPWGAMLPTLEAAVGGALAITAVTALSTRRMPRGDAALPFGVFLAPAIWLGWFLAETGLLERSPFGP